LQLRWQLARDIDQRAEVETMEKVYRLAQDAKDQQTVLGDQAAAIVTNRRLDHATNILEECSFIMADRGLGGPWPGID